MCRPHEVARHYSLLILDVGYRLPHPVVAVRLSFCL